MIENRTNGYSVAKKTCTHNIYERLKNRPIFNTIFSDLSSTLFLAEKIQETRFEYVLNEI